MFPRVERVTENGLNEVIVNFYTDNQSLEIIEDFCVGCGICMKVCPNDAIIVPPTEGRTRIRTEDLIAEVPDPLKCSYCGTCAYMCPFQAISLKKNGTKIQNEDLALRKKHVLPLINREPIFCDRIKKEARIYLEGSLGIDWNKCISCLSCVEVCPTGAFSRKEKDEIEKGQPRIKFDESKCILCGACVNSCSKKVMCLNIDKINHTGNYKEIFWSRIEKKLKE
ncbi:MAG: 4Fe-4S binding protein [Candidatus Hodarchaeota archaeon]